MKQLACFLVVVTVFGAACPAWAGPITEYYIVDGQSAQLSVVQGNSIIRSWTTRDPGEQMPIAVADTVRTFAEHPGYFGSEYDYNGNWTGTDYPDVGGPQGQRIDGGTDGVRRNFLAGYNDGGIWQYDRDWTNPVRLFSAISPTGVTYDTMTGNLWVIEHGISSVSEYTVDGTLLSSFSFGSGWRGCLAYEPATDTLWLSEFASGEIFQFAKDGTLLQSEVIPGLGGYAWGGEFIIPEPGTLSLLSLGLVALLRRR